VQTAMWFLGYQDKSCIHVVESLGSYNFVFYWPAMHLASRGLICVLSVVSCLKSLTVSSSLIARGLSGSEPCMCTRYMMLDA